MVININSIIFIIFKKKKKFIIFYWKVNDPTGGGLVIEIS